MRRPDRMARLSEVTMKMMAAAAVILVRKFPAPLGPNRVWLAPPKIAPIEAPFPVCRSTTRIKTRAIKTWTMLRRMYIKENPFSRD